MNKLKYIFFDLDDTLLDTHRILIPSAVQKACQVMIDNGLNVDLLKCLNSWKQFHLYFTGQELFSRITQEHLIANNVEILERQKIIAKLGYESFLNPVLPDVLPVEFQIIELLRKLKLKYHLILLTQGDPDIQNQKIVKMNIENFFEDIIIIHSLKNETKLIGFNKIISKYNIIEVEQTCLSVGNRLSHEIAFAKQLGIKTCYLKKGEHAHELPQNTFEIPDWTILNLVELEKIILP